MASVNKVILLGNCGRDPEMRYMPSGGAVASLSIATTSRRKDKTTGNTIEDTQWHRITFYERLAEIVGQYVKKGAPLYIEGRLKYGDYTDKDGQKRYTTDIIATELQLLGTKPSSEAPPSANTQRRPPAPATAPTSGNASDAPDDDIPF